jgi:hypothetical protein
MVQDARHLRDPEVEARPGRVRAPPAGLRACEYDAFIPEGLAGFAPSLEPANTGTVSDAERTLARLGAGTAAALGPLARLLLRTESIASSKVEGLQVDVRDLARGEARAETQGKVNPTTAEILGNIDAMELAIDDAAAVATFTPDQIIAVHRRLMTAAPNARIAGVLRTTQNWIGGNDYNPCGADFVPPPPDRVAPLLEDLCHAVMDETLPPLVRQRSSTHSSRRSTPSTTATAVPAAP